MSSKESLSDTMKIAIVIQAAPRGIREKLQLQDFATLEAFRSRMEHYIHTMRVWSAQGDQPMPMDIGAVNELKEKHGKGYGSGGEDGQK